MVLLAFTQYPASESYLVPCRSKEERIEAEEIYSTYTILHQSPTCFVQHKQKYGDVEELFSTYTISFIGVLPGSQPQ